MTQGHVTEGAFMGARLKLKRADQHFAEFTVAIDRFLQSGPFTVMVQDNPEGASRSYRIHFRHGLPRELPFVIGDVIHNLRSALDHVACELVLHGGQVPSQTLAFPIRETRGQVIDAIKGEMQGAVPSDIVTLIVDGIQPHRGGRGHNLWVLHRLDCIDKHRELLPAVESIGFHHIEAVDEDGTTYTGVELKSVGRGELAIFPEQWRAKRLKFRSEGRLTFEVLFRNAESAEGESVIPLLNRFRYEVSKTVDRIEAALAAPSSGTAA